MYLKIVKNISRLFGIIFILSGLYMIFNFNSYGEFSRNSYEVACSEELLDGKYYDSRHEAYLHSQLCGVMSYISVSNSFGYKILALIALGFGFIIWIQAEKIPANISERKKNHE